MTRSTRYSINCRQARGLTLIEVVAGLALMATILVAMLELKTRFTRQLAASNNRLRAVAAADSLIEGWWANLNTFPVNKAGKIPDDQGLNWQTHLLPAITPFARAVRVDVADNAGIVASVDLMLPPERHRAQ